MLPPRNEWAWLVAEHVAAGMTLYTCNGDTRKVSRIWKMKHPDWFRICFSDSSHAWECKRGERVRLKQSWTPIDFYDD